MRNALLLALVGVALSGCARKKHARMVPPPVPAPSSVPSPGPPPVAAPPRSGADPIPGASLPAQQFPAQPQPGDVETGIASWYGHPYDGRQAADGEVYDMETLVAAHRTLPFQTWVRVVNLRNEKAVDVRIIDRGPFIEGRIIDLSHAAAQAIDLIGPGIAPVRVEVIRATASAAAPAAPPHPAAEIVAVPASRRTPASPVAVTIPVAETAARAAFAVQVGVFLDRANAERVRAGMAARYGSARIVRREGDREMWRVLVGAEPTEDGATALSNRIRQESGERNAFVVRLDS